MDMQTDKRFKIPDILKDLLYDAAGGMLVAIGLVNVIANADFAPGGISGVALLMNHFFPQIPFGFLNVILNVPIILFAWRHLGKRYILRSFRSLAVMAFLMDVVAARFPSYTGDKLLACIFGGAFIGTGLAIVFSNASSTAGVDLVVMSLKKMHPHLSVGQITLLIDGIIIISGGIVYGNVDAVLYGFIYTFVTSTIIDRMLSGWVSGKMALIISDGSGSAISQGIYDKVYRGSTILQGKGSYSGQPKEIVLCALSRNQLPNLRTMVTNVDPTALIIILDYSSAYGTGFQNLMEVDANPGF